MTDPLRSQNHNKPVVSAIMANPRKFSEKIALHNQKQAEETAAFEAILRDVSVATRGPVQKTFPQQQHLQLHQNIGNQYRGGSLPNVNQIATNSSIDLQTALQHLEDIRAGGNMQNRMDGRMHVRDRGRQIGPHRRAFPIDKQRADCSPYGSAYLSPPPDTSWRRLFRHLNGANITRTSSDSALHTSAMGPAINTDLDNMPSPTTPPAHRRIIEMVGENAMHGGDGLRKGYWDPKQQMQGSRPKSCEVPNINIYPSAEQENHSGVHVPMTNNTGSLPDLTVLHFPSPLTTPLDAEDQSYSGPQGTPANLSPTSAHQMGMCAQPPSPQSQSPAPRRRPPHGGISPLIINNTASQQMRMSHSPPVSVPNIDPSKLPMDPRLKQQYILHMYQRQQRQRLPNAHPHHSQPHPGAVSHQSQSLPNASQQQPPSNHSVIQASSPSQQQRLPQVCITSADQNDTQPSLSHYRNNVSEGNCQSPTSPHSQTSYSPAQSPGLPPSSWNNSPFADSYQLQQQQQQQTQALQHQFEQFNMSQDNHFTTADTTLTSNGVSSAIYTSQQNSINFSQAMMHGLTGSQEFHQQQHYYPQQIDLNSGNLNSSQNHIMNQNPVQHSPHHQHNNKIPDIVLTGADDALTKQQDFAKELGNAITGMTDSFDTDDLFASDEALKAGLGHLDLDGLQMLTDPNMITDPATEESFKLDRL